MGVKVSDLTDKNLQLALRHAGIQDDFELEDSFKGILTQKQPTVTSILKLIGDSFGDKDKSVQHAVFDAVYNQIIRDLIEAAPKLPADMKKQIREKLFFQGTDTFSNLYLNSGDKLPPRNRIAKNEYSLDKLVEHFLVHQFDLNGEINSDGTFAVNKRRDAAEYALKVLGLKKAVRKNIMKETVDKRLKFKSLFEGKKNPALKQRYKKGEFNTLLDSNTAEQIDKLVAALNNATTVQELESRIALAQIKHFQVNKAVLKNIVGDNQYERKFLNSEVGRILRLKGFPDPGNDRDTLLQRCNVSELSGNPDYTRSPFKNFDADERQAADAKKADIADVIGELAPLDPTHGVIEQTKIDALKAIAQEEPKVAQAEAKAFLDAIDEIAPRISAGSKQLVKNYPAALQLMSDALNGKDKTEPYTSDMLRRIFSETAHTNLVDSALRQELIAGAKTDKNTSPKFQGIILNTWLTEFSKEIKDDTVEFSAARQALSKKERFPTRTAKFFKGRVDFAGYLQKMKALANEHLAGTQPILAANAGELSKVRTEVESFVNAQKPYIDKELANFQALLADLETRRALLEKVLRESKALPRKDGKEVVSLLRTMDRRLQFYRKTVEELKALQTDMNEIQAVLDGNPRPVMLDEDRDAIFIPESVTDFALSGDVTPEGKDDEYITVAKRAYQKDREAQESGQAELSTGSSNTDSYSRTDAPSFKYAKSTGDEIICSNAYRFPAGTQGPDGQSVEGQADLSVFAIGRSKDANIIIRTQHTPQTERHRSAHLYQLAQTVMMNQEFIRTQDSGYQPSKYIFINPARSGGQISEDALEQAAELCAIYLAMGVDESKISTPPQVLQAAQGLVEKIRAEHQWAGEEPGVEKEFLRIRMGLTAEDKEAASYLTGNRKPTLLQPKP